MVQRKFFGSDSGKRQKLSVSMIGNPTEIKKKEGTFRMQAWSLNPVCWWKDIVGRIRTRTRRLGKKSSRRKGAKIKRTSCFCGTFIKYYSQDYQQTKSNFFLMKWVWTDSPSDHASFILWNCDSRQKSESLNAWRTRV